MGFDFFLVLLNQSFYSHKSKFQNKLLKIQLKSVKNICAGLNSALIQNLFTSMQLYSNNNLHHKVFLQNQAVFENRLVMLTWWEI